MIDVLAAGACDHAAVYLDYDVVAQGSVEPATTITFINPVGDDVRVSQVPLHGRAMWPGIVLRHDGTVIDWPGWRKEHGVWVAGDEFDWALNEVVVEFEAGSVVDLVVDYPDATDTCIPTPQGAVDFSEAAPTTPPTIDPPATSTLEVLPAAPDGRPSLLLLLFAATLTAAGFGVAFRRTAPVAGLSVHIETAAEFTSRVARTRRTRTARRSSAPARSRARRA
jgi:hypothetical protein